jgi:glycosyltransferase involved in cell wall biosynthesis
MNAKKEKPIIIGIVLPYLNPRGTEKQALGLARGFIEKGARVVLFVVQGWGSQDMYQAFTRAGVDVVNVGTACNVNGKKVQVLRFFSLYKRVNQYQCNILLSRAIISNQVTGIAGRLARIPTLAVISGPLIRQKSGRKNYIHNFISLILFKKNLGFPSHIITVSKEGRDNLIFNYPILKDSVTCIQNGVDIDEIIKMSQMPKRYLLPDNRFNLCYSGSIVIERKGLDILIEAVRHLVNDLKQEDILLTFVGGGPDFIKVKSLVNQYALQKYVHFSGETSNPHSIIQQADIFILPSRSEGLPNALLEAMALGVCCIASDCNTGPREIIEDKKNGLLVPVGSSSALSDAILYLKNDIELRKRLAKQGAETVKSAFSYKMMVDSYYHLFRILLSDIKKIGVQDTN